MILEYLPYVLLFALATIIVYGWGMWRSMRQKQDLSNMLSAKGISGVKKALKKNGPMTAKELALLKKLNENRGNIVTFDALSDAVWGENYYGYENTLMVHIRRLREKIEEDPSHPAWLLTVRGLGYKLAKGGKTGS